jgi:pyrimidine deaminase RibD-like protein
MYPSLDEEMRDVRRFMRTALKEGRRALPGCLPNPPVGCVLVRGEQTIACGYTQSPGQPHAEAMALSQVSGDLSDVSAYVTLGPCSFHGRTPSCAKALIDRAIGRVFVATLDPDPRNSGAGIKLLESAAIIVEIGMLEKEALEDLRAVFGENLRAFLEVTQLSLGEAADARSRPSGA